MFSELLTRRRPFALLRREDRDSVEVFTGEMRATQRLRDLPLPAEPGPATLAIVPYRQIGERGFEFIDDGAPLRHLAVDGYREVPLDRLLAAAPSRPVALVPGGFDVDDATYTDIVRSVLREEIGRGEGSNFVIHRTYTGGVVGDPVAAALSVFERLLRGERGAYWTFCVFTGDRCFVGASPERHVSVADGLVMMNPISGTYRHPAAPSRQVEPGARPDEARSEEARSGEARSGEARSDELRDGLLRFLRDPKEIDELYMVLDEELKMMATVADLGGHVVGPYLKEMAHLTHTEYLLAGRSSLDVRDVLRETMFAPTVVGSPIENACRVIARHERHGRGYYGGVLALLGRDGEGRQTLDAPILIRCAEFEVPDAGGPDADTARGADTGRGAGTNYGKDTDRGGATSRFRVSVGATLVRHSVAEDEVAETHAKARGVLSALGLVPGRDADTTAGFAADPQVRELLAGRNATLADFWLRARDPGDAALAPELAGRSVLVVDAEDTFTGMLVHQVRALGATVSLCSYRDVGRADPDGHDIVVAGPGPGDPRDPADARIAVLRRLVTSALARRQPLLGVCLGHQVLAGAIGLPLIRKETPYQGVQREIDFFGRPERVGFYSTFTAVAAEPTVQTRYGEVRLSRDPGTGEVHALRGPTFAGVQFHAESVLSQHGIGLLRDLMASLAAAPAPR